MKIIGRDKITQSGDNSNLQIDNKEDKVSWHNTWWGRIFIGVAIGVILYFLF